MAKKPLKTWITCWSLAVAILLFLLIRSPSVVVLCLAAIFGLCVHSIWNFWWIEDGMKRRVGALAVFIVFLVLVGFNAWPRAAELSSETKTAPTELVSQQKPEIDRLGPTPLPRSSPSTTATVLPLPSAMVTVESVPVVNSNSQKPNTLSLEGPTTQANQTQLPTDSVSVSEREFHSEREDLKYGLEVMISTKVPIHPVHMILICSGPIGSASLRFRPTLSAGVIISNMPEVGSFLIQNSYEFSFARPPFTPKVPLEVRLRSATKIHVLELKLK